MPTATAPQYVVDDRGHKKAVILNIDKYEEMVEDLESLALIADAKKGPATPWETVKKRLKERGRI
jgi:PHD/YefM family antitoxin component YafN of YafNO toxin-antitoxin module